MVDLYLSGVNHGYNKLSKAVHLALDVQFVEALIRVTVHMFIHNGTHHARTLKHM